jgi:hypothetical protein
MPRSRYLPTAGLGYFGLCGLLAGAADMHPTLLKTLRGPQAAPPSGGLLPTYLQSSERRNSKRPIRRPYPIRRCGRCCLS